MKYFVAALIAAIAAAKKSPETHEIDATWTKERKVRYEEGTESVDELGLEVYSASKETYGGHSKDCEHAIGHDGTYSYIRITPAADFKDEHDSAGDYIESTTMYNGKHLYMNDEKKQFMLWQDEKWSIAKYGAKDDEGYFYQVERAKKGQKINNKAIYHNGKGGDKPEKVNGFSITWETDMDLEPEWRCLMRPLLVQAVGYVEEAELSIESKMLLEEKKQLVAVHEELVIEAKKRAEEAACIETIEKAMAALQECELKVLRTYVKLADPQPSEKDFKQGKAVVCTDDELQAGCRTWKWTEKSKPAPVYPQDWLGFLHDKYACVEEFSKATASCNHHWTDQWSRYYGPSDVKNLHQSLVVGQK